MNKEILYTLKVWVTGFMLAPAILLLYEVLKWNTLGIDTMETWVMFVMFGALFSVPSALLLCFVTMWIRRSIPQNPVKMKLVLTVAGIGFAILPFLVLSRSYLIVMSEEAMIYTATIVAGIWFYKLGPRDQPVAYVLDEGHPVH